MHRAGVCSSDRMSRRLIVRLAAISRYLSMRESSGGQRLTLILRSEGRMMKHYATEGFLLNRLRLGVGCVEQFQFDSK